MFHFRHFIFICTLFLLTGCYKSETVIELNRDGSGVVTFTLNYDKATNEQRAQIKALYNQPNVSSSFSLREMKKAYPSPYFEVVELKEDKDNLIFKSVIKFTDINRLLAANIQGANTPLGTNPLRGLDFDVEADTLIFKITRAAADIGLSTRGMRLEHSLKEVNKQVLPTEKIKIIDAQTGNFVEFYHEYKSDKKANEIKWQKALEMPGLTIKRKVIRYNFANYPELEPVAAKITEAAWIINKGKFNQTSYLDLELSVPLPTTEGFSYLGWDKSYLISGRYSDGTPLKFAERQTQEFSRFKNQYAAAGYGRFKLPLELNFPKLPVKGINKVLIRLRVLRSKRLHRVDLGKLMPNNTYEADPFTFTTTSLRDDKFSLDVKGPIAQLKRFLIRTKRGNIFPLRVSSSSILSDQGSISFWDFLPLADLNLLVEFYEPIEYCWLDVEIPAINFPAYAENVSEQDAFENKITEIFPEYLQKKLPPYSQAIFENREKFKEYCSKLTDDEVIPAMLQLAIEAHRVNADKTWQYAAGLFGRGPQYFDPQSYDSGKSKYDVWQSYQEVFLKELKTRSNFLEKNKKDIALVLFHLYGELYPFKENKAAAILLSQLNLSELLQAEAFKALKEGKYIYAQAFFFPQSLSREERIILKRAFKEIDDWTRQDSILELLAQGPDADLDFLRKVLIDDTGDNLVRVKAFKLLANKETKFPAALFETYLLDPEIRKDALGMLRDKIKMLSEEDMSGKEFQKALKKIISILEDLSEQKNEWQREDAVRAFKAIQAKKMIAISLKFDGKILNPTAKPSFSCYSYTRNKWVNCGIKPNELGRGYLMRRPALGEYRMHVSIDENKSNPRRYPGDFEAILKFKVTEDAPDALTVNVPRLIHLKTPDDNNRSMEGMFGPCEKKPAFETPLFSWGPSASVPFSWDPVTDGAQYFYSVFRAQCSPFKRGAKITSGKSAKTKIILNLPPSEDGEYYIFKVIAQKEGRLVGDFFTHDSGGYSWNYCFRVINKSIPHWVYYIAAVVLLLALLGLRSFIARGQKRFLMVLRWSFIIVFVLGLLSIGIYYGYKQRQQRKAQEIRNQKQKINRKFIEQWQSAAPLPEWWEEIAAPAYKINTLGDLLSAWQSGQGGLNENRQFFKAAYQAILEHSDDPRIVPEAIHLLHYVSQDYPYRIEMEEFGIEHFFYYKQRTDNCANCMAGDTVQGMVVNLAHLYLQKKDYDKGIKIIQRLLKEREHEISNYKLAQTYNVLGIIYWEKGLKDKAITVLREGVQKYGDTVYGNRLKRTLEKYEKEL